MTKHLSLFHGAEVVGHSRCLDTLGHEFDERHHFPRKMPLYKALAGVSERAER
jgi:hypothetical protein